MKVSIVISAKNRAQLFSRSLALYSNQTMAPEDWELVLVDDASTEDLRGVLRAHGSKLNWRYIRMDSHLNDFPVYWGPALSNNVGFRAARGEVVCVTGPEILLAENALEKGYEGAMKDQNVYGYIFHSSSRFVRMMDAMEKIPPFATLDRLPGARHQDITRHTFYWFFCAVKREHIEAIGGCDEEFMRGICGDDDDFANRMRAHGVPSVHDYTLVGIHQDHTREDRGDPQRIRWNPVWEKARHQNTKYLEEWPSLRNQDPVANKSRDWGSSNLVLEREDHFV